MFQLGVTGVNKLVAQSPYWDMPSNKDLDIMFDATRNGFKNKPTWGGELSSLITSTHAQTIYQLSAAGVYNSFATDVLPRTNLGLLTIPTKTYDLIFPNLMTSSGWQVANGMLRTQIAATGNTVGNGPITRLTTDAANVNSNLSSVGSTTYTLNETYTHRSILKYVDNPWIQISVTDNAVAACHVWVNVQTGVIGQKQTANVAQWVLPTATIVALSDGSYQVDMTVTRAGATTTIGAIGYRVVTTDGFATGALSKSVDLMYSNRNQGASCPTVVIGGAVAVVINGNQPVISGLGASLATGIVGYIKIRAQGFVNESKILHFSDGTTNNLFDIKCSGTNTIRVVCIVGGVTQAAFNINGVIDASVDQTIVFIGTANYYNARLVGQVASAADVSGTWPVLDRVGLGGQGFTAINNSYQFTKKLGLDFLAPGDDPVAKFDAMYTLALTV